MKKIFLLSIFIPLLVSNASFLGFWNNGNTQKINVARNYQDVNDRYIDFTPARFEKLKRNNENFAIYFHANWCVSCRVMDYNLNRNASAFSGTVLKIDFDAAQTLKKRYRVVVPDTFIFFREGRAVVRNVNPEMGMIVRNLE